MKRNTRINLARILSIGAIALLATAPILAQDDMSGLGIEELYRLDRLAMLRDSIEVASISSYDRTGGNNDGFDGLYSFVRKEEGGLVLADLKGPGIIYRISTPTPTADIVEFYFDGESEPRIEVKLEDIFNGKHPAFPRPLVGYGGGGTFCYVPIPYQKSCKIFIRTELMRFYQINYATYPEDAPVESFSSEPSPEYLEHIEKAKTLFAACGGDISSYVTPPGVKPERIKSKVTLKPGKAVTIFDMKRPGRITGIRIEPAEALMGKERDVVLRAFWDGGRQPAILSPAGDFFGYAWGGPAVKSLLVGTADGGDYCYFPMPFDKSGRIELYAEPGYKGEASVEAEVTFAPVPRRGKRGQVLRAVARVRIRQRLASLSRLSKQRDAVT